MRILYDIFFIVFAVLYIPYLLVKRKWHKDFFQKFGFLPKDLADIDKPVWIHAVSVGEAHLAVKLAEKIKKHNPGLRVVVSTTTNTGNEIVRIKGKGVIDAVFYFPLDLGMIVDRVVRLIDPRLYIMVETELWPNLLNKLHSSGIPVVLANGRISGRSFKNYRKTGPIIRRIVSDVDICCMQSESDADRIKALGVLPEKVFVTGNMKFDEVPSQDFSSDFSKRSFGFREEDNIIIAGSTHFSEEQTVINIYRHLREKHRNLKLVIAPRHVERTDAIEVYLAKSGMKYHRFSKIMSASNNTPDAIDVLLVDTIGHLKDIYRVATLIFVGGSLVRKGGQNPIEGARLGKPIIFGPYMYNFKEISEIFLNGEAALRVNDEKELTAALDGLLKDHEKRRNLALNAERIVKENTGALDRTLEKIEPLL